MSVRCKFRCMSLMTHAENGVTVNLLPVIAKSKHWPEGSEENRMFWEATPSGEATLVFKPEAEVPFKSGQFYYIDLTEMPGSENKDHWKLWELVEHEHSLGVKVSLGWSNDRPDLARGDLSMQIENLGAWPAFQGKVGTRWEVVFTPA